MLKLLRTASNVPANVKLVISMGQLVVPAMANSEIPAQTVPVAPDTMMSESRTAGNVITNAQPVENILLITRTVRAAHQKPLTSGSRISQIQIWISDADARSNTTMMDQLRARSVTISARAATSMPQTASPVPTTLQETPPTTVRARLGSTKIMWLSVRPVPPNAARALMQQPASSVRLLQTMGIEMRVKIAPATRAMSKLMTLASSVTTSAPPALVQLITATPVLIRQLGISALIVSAEMGGTTSVQKQSVPNVLINVQGASQQPPTASSPAPTPPEMRFLPAIAIPDTTISLTSRSVQCVATDVTPALKAH